MRHMSADRSGTIFRAVMRIRYVAADGTITDHVSVHGPYATHGAAKGAVTRETRPVRDWGSGTREVTGHVEQSAVIWIPAE